VSEIKKEGRVPGRDPVDSEMIFQESSAHLKPDAFVQLDTHNSGILRERY